MRKSTKDAIIMAITSTFTHALVGASAYQAGKEAGQKAGQSWKAKSWSDDYVRITNGDIVFKVPYSDVEMKEACGDVYTFQAKVLGNKIRFTGCSLLFTEFKIHTRVEALKKEQEKEIQKLRNMVFSMKRKEQKREEEKAKKREEKSKSKIKGSIFAK